MPVDLKIIKDFYEPKCLNTTIPEQIFESDTEKTTLLQTHFKNYVPDTTGRITEPTRNFRLPLADKDDLMRFYPSASFASQLRAVKVDVLPVQVPLDGRHPAPNLLCTRGPVKALGLDF